MEYYEIARVKTELQKQKLKIRFNKNIYPNQPEYTSLCQRFKS